ncbi:MAG: hypothetical protein GY768_02860 [Planctomycetaceae bacterium]|nr:hypothetical protein [Planctomycetaceae bacterium]
MLDATVIISELMARNDEGLRDEDGDSPDWIELLNVGRETVDLNGWHLTDDAENPNDWQFPPLALNPGEHLVVFASGKDRDNPLRPLHTNFKLEGDGEYLALTRPDESIEFEFAPDYPPQVEDVSYGIPNQITQTLLVNEGAEAQVLIPVDDRWDPSDLVNGQFQGSWLDPQLETTADPWFSATTGIGYRDEADDPTPQPGSGTEVASSLSQFSSFQNRDGWRYGYWDAAGDEDGLYQDDEFRSFIWSGLTSITTRNHWDGTKWDLATAPKTSQIEMSAEGGHPSGENSGGLQYAVRRWNSDVQGSILIHGRLENPISAGDGTVARVFVDGNEVYARQVNGFGVDYRFVVPVGDGDRVDFVIDPGAAKDDVGDQTIFTATIEDVTELVGEAGGQPTLGDHIATDIGSLMKGRGSTAYMRIPFVPSVADFDSLTLHVQYDDAFVAYLNGQPIASAGAPEPGSVAWDSTAIRDRTVEEALHSTSFNVSNAIDHLSVGTENVLMIHALNHAVDNKDFLMLPKLVGTTLEINPLERRYFVSPTPDAGNGLGDVNAGPVIVPPSFSPERPTAADPIVVAARIAKSFHDVSTVQLTYRAMYGASQEIAMRDDGVGNDVAAGDGIYTATIPSGIAEPGEMIRWFVTAKDKQQHASRAPRFEIARDSEEYYGTVITDPTLSSNLPIFHWFVSSRSRVFTGRGTQGSLYYDGEFYDNVGFDLHGQSSSGFPTTKKSMNVDLPADHRFRLNDDIPRMKDFNFLTNFADKSKLRNTLGYEQRAFIGDAYHLAFPVRVQHNGEFFAVYDFVEDGDNRWLERLGYDPEGALYKMYNRMDSASGEKKTRKDEGSSDLRDLVSGVALNGQARNRFIFDNIDLASMANYLAGFVLTSNRDCCHKNYYAYRDTNNSGEWRYMPWDVDLSQGRNWGGFGRAYFDDTMYPDNDLFMGQNNRLISALYATPGFREMYLRRVRSVIDAYVKPLGTPADQLPLETRVDELVQYLEADAALDNRKHRATWGQVGIQSFEEATEILKTEYAQPRREFLYQTQVMADDAEVRVIVSSDPQKTDLRYWVPRNNSLGNNWTRLDFNDSSWQQGPTGIGFEKSASGTYDPLIATDIVDEMSDRTSVFVRIPFQVESLEDLNDLTLRMKYDDGFIAYLNGTEVAREGVGNGVARYDMTSRGHADSQAVEFENIDISAFVNQLRVGGNVLAIQAVNSSTSSSDMLMVPELVDGKISASNGEIPTAQIGNPRIDITAVDFNPLSGNQDEEYLQLTNNNDFAVDLSGWELTDGVELTFKPGTVLPAGWSLYATPNAFAFRARESGPSGGQQLFVQGNYQGHLSNFGESISLLGADGELVSSFEYEGDPTVWQAHLHVSELMYHPLAPSSAELARDSSWIESDFEFIELENSSTELELDLTGVRFTDGVEFDFANSQLTKLKPQERVIVVSNLAAFTTRYGTEARERVAGEFSTGSGFRDGGETIKLEDETSSTIFEFQYSDDQDRGWPARADGRGSSLVKRGRTSDNGQAINWMPSNRIHGTPGSDSEEVAFDLQINEIVSRSDLPEVDHVELLNVSDQRIDVSHYYLSDTPTDGDSLARFSIPDGSLGAGEFLVFGESELNPSDDPRGFAFNGTRGDELHLSVGTQEGPTHFVDSVQFPAADLGESFGRVGSGPLGPMRSITLGAANSDYRVGPILISELQYHPSQPSAAALELDSQFNSEDLEFIEIHNAGAAAIGLSGWRIRGDVDFDFAQGTALDAGETVLLLRFNPDRAGNETRKAAFFAHYGLPRSTRLLGGFQGKLENDGDRVTLQRPGTPSVEDPEVIPRLWVDEVRFDDVAPWPASADGQGDSLQRTQVNSLGLMVASWRAASPTPAGVDWGAIPGDLNSDGTLNLADIDLFSLKYQLTPPDLSLDLTGDQRVNDADRDYLISDLFQTTYGDADLNRLFNSSDLVQIFSVGEYEDGIDGNSTWSEGDWNLDGDFDSSDLVIAFAAGGYASDARPVDFDSDRLADLASAIQAHDKVFADEKLVTSLRD